MSAPDERQAAENGPLRTPVESRPHLHQGDTAGAPRAAGGGAAHACAVRNTRDLLTLWRALLDQACHCPAEWEPRMSASQLPSRRFARRIRRLQHDTKLSATAVLGRVVRPLRTE